MHKQLLTPLCLPAIEPTSTSLFQKFKFKHRREIGAVKRSLKRNQSTIIALMTAFFLVQINHLAAMAADSTNGFGQAVDAVKGNSIVSGAGAAATDLMTFPFVIAGVILLLVVILAVIVGISALLSGRDWATPFLNIFAMIALILLGSAVIGWVATSGLFGSGSAPVGG
jgi:hypothetical protein